MQALKGIAISPGYADGVAVVYDYETDYQFVCPDRDILPAELGAEHGRLDDAMEQSQSELDQAEQSPHGPADLADSTAVLSSHAQLVQDIAAQVKQHLSRKLVNVEQALDSVIGTLVDRLCQIENEYLRAREQDIRDVGRRMMRHLTGSPRFPFSHLPEHAVIVARELLPSEAVELSRAGLAAIVTEQGGPDSHTAILARALGIPSVTGLVEVTSQIQSGMRLLVDGEAGKVTIAPSAAELAEFSTSRANYQRTNAAMAVNETLPCVTRDGIAISLLGNIGRPEEAEQIGIHNLSGVGLFRTEFLFLESHERPSFETQCDMYARAANVLEDRPLVIRTFDLGGDKLPPFLASQRSGPQPSRHLRGLRFSLAERLLFETQLRAIVQVAQTADVRILFPMIVGSHDFSCAIATVDQVLDRLDAPRRPALGAMIETPAALFALKEILELADFVSIGTNDLTQYMLATDRRAADLTDECTAWHPAVLRAIQRVVDVAGMDCPVCVCGEEAGEPGFARLLIGLGVRELSMTPGRAAPVRQALRSIDCSTMRELASQALCCTTPGEVRRLLADDRD
ncbi:MAG: phosphoenolpyruvate--protein phosphotransferase [Pirellulaceae bacterium]|nr:phosphoenolpyruvate--protein phosphotransferase [Pirellulaceae bacterium]